MTRSSRKVIILMIMFILVALYFVSGTYARYTSSINGKTSVSTANWAVKFKKGTTEEVSNNFDLAFTVDNNNNNNVVPGKIAPSVTAKATINLDLTGTEVAVDYTATIDKTALAAAFGASANNVTVTVNGSDSATGTKSLVDNVAFTETNGIVAIEIAITWDNKDDAASASDTTSAGKNLTLPVTLTVQQHID